MDGEEAGIAGRRARSGIPPISARTPVFQSPLFIDRMLLQPLAAGKSRPSWLGRPCSNPDVVDHIKAVISPDGLSGLGCLFLGQTGDHSSFAPASASLRSRSTASSNSLPLRFL